MLNVPETCENETNRLNHLEFVFIIETIMSLEENHLIELEVNITGLIKSNLLNLRIIITMHCLSLHNVLYYEPKRMRGYISQKF